MWNRSKKNGMEINDELIACYVEGTATAEEQALVRQYLCEHPEEYMHLLYLMDADIEDYLNEYNEESCDIVPLESSFTDIACSAAAFAPQQNKSCKPKGLSEKPKINGWYGRLREISNTLNIE